MAKGSQSSFWGNEDIPELIAVVDVQLCEYTSKSHQIIYFKWRNCLVYRLYLNKAVFKRDGASISFQPDYQKVKSSTLLCVDKDVER